MTQRTRTIFITGSSSGLGRAAAKLFSARGWKVIATAVLWSRNPGGSMTIALAGPVSAFFEAERTQDLEGLARCFTEHGTVRDEGRTIEGHDAIKRWMMEAKAKYQHTVDPLAVSQRDGFTVVTARVAGKLPNSPLDLQHVFAVEGGRIVSLEIQ